MSFENILKAQKAKTNSGLRRKNSCLKTREKGEWKKKKKNVSERRKKCEKMAAAANSEVSTMTLCSSLSPQFNPFNLFCCGRAMLRNRVRKRFSYSLPPLPPSESSTMLRNKFLLYLLLPALKSSLLRYYSFAIHHSSFKHCRFQYSFLIRFLHPSNTTWTL